MTPIESKNFESHLSFIGQKIANARHGRDEKIETVAVAIGVSNKVISQIENGRYYPLKMKMITELCEYLQIPINELFGDGYHKIE